MDPGPQRRRGPHARVQPHQAAQAPFQRALARRQELPVPGAHDGGGVAPGYRAPGPAQHPHHAPLLRALRPRLRHPRDVGPATAHLPGAQLQRHQVRPPPAPGPAVPALPHRALCRAVRRLHRARPVLGPSGGVRHVPRRRHRSHPGAARGADARGGRQPRVRTGGPAAGPHRLCAQGHREAADGERAARGPRLLRHRRRRAGGCRPGLLREAGAGGGPQGLHSRQGGRPRPSPVAGQHPPAALLRRCQRGPPRSAGPGPSRRGGPARRVAVGPAGRGPGRSPGPAPRPPSRRSGSGGRRGANAGPSAAWTRGRPGWAGPVCTYPSGGRKKPSWTWWPRTPPKSSYGTD